MEKLKAEIKRLRRVNASNHYFVPELRLYSLMTQDAVRSALEDWPRYRQEEVASHVVPRGRKIFGILLLSGQAAQLSKFIEAAQLEDARLPFKKEALVQDIQLSQDDATDFFEKQWEFTAPTFLRGTLNRTFDKGTVLPFLSTRELDEGGFGKVCEATLDPEHQKMESDFPAKFAVKEFKIRKKSSVNHKKELENLAILNHLKHPNIVELLGSYTYEGRHNLLFELADAGNLAELLVTERSETQFVSDESLVIALAELSSAVEHVHNFMGHGINLDLIGCHHDLRPRNVLVSGSRFILSDFGLSTFKSSTEQSATPFMAGMDDYLAPDDPIHRASDIWSLGCIISELTTYMVYGRDGIERFRSVRKFKATSIITLHQYHQGYGCPSKPVLDWLSDLSASSREVCALLVPLARDMLHLDQSQRPTAKEATRRLRLIALREVASSVDAVFAQAKDRGYSLDMFLEHTKFSAWRYAMEIFGLENSSVLQSESNHSDMSQFAAILDNLYSLREDIQSRLSRETPAQEFDFSRLLGLNDELHHFLNREQKELSRKYFHITVLREGDEMLEQLENKDTSVMLGHEIRVRASIKHVSNLFARQPNSTSRSLRLNPSVVSLTARFNNHHLGLIRDDQDQITRQVWVEWRGYGNHGSKEDDLERLYGRAAGLAERLSQEKPESFRTLKCRGYFHDPVRMAFGVVFDVPESPQYAEFLEPTSLQQIIKDTQPGSKAEPDLDDKFRLALSLAESLLELHTVQWLHKRLAAENIVFFRRAAGVKEGSILAPFLVGFDHSRPDDPSDFTSGVSNPAFKDYQHPEYLKNGSGYRHEYEYYSLGIILMEIGFWRPFAEIVNRSRYRGLSYEDRRQELLIDRVPRLKQHMGRAYSEAVRCCIQGDFGGSVGDGAPEKNTLLQFGEKVVGRLRGCSI